jgi:DNA-binding response OmpR family regulator
MQTVSSYGVELRKQNIPVRQTLEIYRSAVCYLTEIYEQVWEKEYTGDSRTIDLHVQRLKKKLGWDKHICAVYKIGYRLET